MITETRLDADLSWLVATGPRDAVFRELGTYAASDIHAALDSLPERDGLERFAATTEGAAIVARIVAATRQRYPAESRELDDIAAGAGRDRRQVWLANLRGDLGAADGTGCTDLAWRGARSYVAHNEDGAPGLAGRYRLLTLLVDGEVPVTAGWYPGFLPANAHVVTGHGLAWGINHLPVTRPAPSPGRVFVARAAQHLPSVAAVVEHLDGNASAGGFAYSIGARGTGEVAVVETGAGRATVTMPGPDSPLVWHTNHVRWLDPITDGPQAAGASAALDTTVAGRLGGEAESRARGAVLDRLRPSADPDADWFCRILVDAPVPDGVRRDAAGTDPLLTLCTTVVDLTAETITVVGRAGTGRTFGWDDMVHGLCPSPATPTDRTRT